MDLNIILHEKSWILEKIAVEIYNYSKAIGNDSMLSYGEASPGYTTYFHIWYLYAQPVMGARNFIYVTHIDADWKIKRLDHLVSLGIDGIICFSNQMRELLSKRYSNVRVTSILPASSMASPGRRKCPLKLGYISRIYKDGRKNEQWLLDLAQTYSPSELSFLFIGYGWRDISLHLCRQGYLVEWIPQYELTSAISAMTNVDLFLYLGFDEGSISVIDYLSQRKKCLISNQGFHRELAVAAPRLVRLFDNRNEFMEILQNEIESARKWEMLMADLEWKSYAKKLCRELFM